MSTVRGDIAVTTPNYLILDQGGSSSRAMVFTAEGELLCSVRQPVATVHLHIAWVEQNPEEVLASVIRVGRQALAQLDTQQRNLVQSCGLVTQRSSMVCWDKQSGAALSPILSWQDTRASTWLAEQALDVEKIHALTGLFPNAHFGASKMRWCLDHLVPVQRAASQGRLCMAPLASYLAYKLLDNSPYIIDPANASRTLLMNVASGDWEPSLLAEFAISQEWLPEIVTTTKYFGDINWREDNEEAIPLALINGDQSAATYSGGRPKSDNIYINIGTGGFIYRVIDAPVTSDRLLNSIVCWRNKKQAADYVLEGTVNGAGSALQWYGQKLKVDNINDWQIQQLAQLDKKWPQTMPLFLNGVGGLGSPDWRANFAVKFVGQGDESEKFAAIVESIIFLLYRNFLLLINVGGAEGNQQIVISGGLSRSDSICQALSDLSRLKVVRSDDYEASARGAAFLLSSPNYDWRDLDEEVFFPATSQFALALQARFRQWSEMMEQALSSL